MVHVGHTVWSILDENIDDARRLSWTDISFLELENESKFCHVNDECSDSISLLLENNPLYCDCNMQQVRDQHENIFGDLEITQCVNQDITVFEFHDELCCDINNID